MGRYPSSFFRKLFHARYLAGVLLFSTLLSQCSFLPFFITQIAEAAVVTIDNATSATTNEHLSYGSRTVFTTDLVGYKFYVDSTGQCVYSKTTNGGGSWGTAVVVDAQTDCDGIAVWYDRWTPGDFGDFIHITTMESGSATDGLFYNRLDTTTDTRLMGTAPVNIISNSGQGGSLVAGTNSHAMTKSTSGEIFVTTSDATDAYVVRCAASCNLTTGWTEAGPTPLDLANDWSLLMPLLGGEILLINRDISADVIRSRVWNGSSWSVSWNNIGATAVESATYDVGMSATMDHASGDIYLAYAADHDNYTTIDHDVRTAIFSSGNWSVTTAVFTNRASRGLHDVAIARDTNTGIIYVAYTLRTTPATATTANVYYATSTSAMSSWSPERGPVNLVAQNLYGLDLNVMSDERIYVSWHDPNLDDILGETIADIAPITRVSRLGTPTASVTASTSNVYLGGTFVIKESQASRSVTDITITESGTIDGFNDVANVTLLYDVDTSAPYDCVSESYAGSELQFGSVDVNGFSGGDGVSSFTGSETISPTRAMCVYVVADILDSANDGDTIAVSIAAPADDVLVSGGIDVSPVTPVSFLTSTAISNDELTQIHYHWRNDNGSETTATSASGGVQDTPLAALQQNSPRRLRIAVSNEGSVAAPASSFRLEYSEAAPTCAEATGWTDVGAANDAWNMFDSSGITEGGNTTNISTAVGGVTDENTTFLTPNGGVRDTASQTGSLTLSSTNFVELEYSIVPTTFAIEGATYCFRVTNAGIPVTAYAVYPSVTISADVSVSVLGTQTATLIIPSTNQYVGGSFVFRENVSSRTVTDITITETGTVDAMVDIDTIRLRYDLDTTAPYNCVSESYAGSETQFGATDTDGFSGPNGSSTFSGSATITTTQALCVYVVLDVTSTAANGETIDIEISQGGNDVVVSTGSVSPSTPLLLSGSTTLAGAVIDQTNYHWRNDDGSEAAATSATGGNQNTAVVDHQAETPIRLRLGVSNSGAAPSSAHTYTLEFGPKITTCADVGVWTFVGAAADDWDTFDSANLTQGGNTTNIATATGGVTDPGGKTFLSSNGGVNDTSATSSPIVLTTTQFTELEYSIQSSDITLYDTTYCFRVTNAGEPLGIYSSYAEITTAPKRDFKVQRGNVNVSGTSVTLTAGVDYVAPSSTSSAFVRITNTHHTGAGKSAAGGGSLNADDTTAYITAATDITSSFTISRPPAATSDTRVSWEIVEFIGAPGTDNEMIVRGVGTVALASGALSGTGPTVPVGDDADVVVYITGVENRDVGRNLFYAGQVSSSWSPGADQPVLTRASTGAVVNASYAIVEYTGINWNVQRVEHTYSAVGVTETENITPVNNLSRTFIHAQKRMTALGNVNNFGHEVWLSSIGAVSFQLEGAATTPAGHTSVVWIVENMQTSNGKMKVQRSNGTTSGGTEPVTIQISIFTPINGVNNASIFSNTRVVGANTTFPNVFAAASITSTTTYQLWRSEASNVMTYRTEIVEWPVSGLAVRQDYYRFYVDNDALLPTDAWPAGVSDLGENTSITAVDEPPGDGDRMRLRMTLKVSNASLPAGLYDFKLQYGLRATTCSAVGSWVDVGEVGSGAIWRLYDAPGVLSGVPLSTNPPAGGDLLISVSDVAGSYVESIPSPANPYPASPDDDIEYDWNLEHNGALEKSTYCFRMIRSDGEQLDGYINYPQVRTAGFTPVIKNWRWHNDTNNETPSMPLASESIAPTEVVNQNEIALRVTVDEIKNVIGTDIKFKVQYDETPLFTNPRDVVATSTCTATSTWCYTLASAIDNQDISTAVLSTSDACASGVGDGCGVHNTSGTYVTGDFHPQGSNREYAFYIKPAAARVGAVYYFRLVEMSDDVPVILAASSSYPSLVAESATLAFTVSGLPAGTTTAGVVLDASSTPSAISFGSIPLNTPYTAAHRISLTTNATEGYRVLMFARQPLLNAYGTAIASVTGTNAVPASWASGCSISATGCVGYHTTDATLFGGSARFSPLDSFAGLDQSPREVMYNSLPSQDIHDILYRIRVNQLQPAGTYETEIVYIAVPTY